MSLAFNGGALGSQASHEQPGEQSLFKVSRSFFDAKLPYLFVITLYITNMLFFQSESVLQYQNKALASANKELRHKVESLAQEVAKMEAEMHSVDANIG